jgi:WD40 repeat protein
VKYKDYPVPDPTPTRRRFRLLRWSLLAGSLVGLGLLLNGILAPQPRCVIPISSKVKVDFLSDDGLSILTKPIGEFEKSGFAPWQGPFQTWNTRSGKNLGIYLADVTAIEDCVQSPCGRYTAARAGGLLHLVDLKLGREFQGILRNMWNSPKWAFSSQGTYLAVGEGRTTTVVKCSSGGVARTFSSNLDFFRFTVDESFLAMDEKQQKDFVLWNPRNEEVVKTFENMYPEELSSDGRTLLAELLGRGRHHILLDILTQESRPLNPRFGWLVNFRSAFSPDGKTLVTFNNSQVAFWDVASGEQRGVNDWPHGAPPGEVWGFFSPDSGLFLMVYSGESGLSLWETASGKMLWKRDCEGAGAAGWKSLFPHATRFSADGQYLFVPEVERFQIIRVKTGETWMRVQQELVEINKDCRLFAVREMPLKQKPGFLQKLLGHWWPSSTNPDDMKVTVFETATGRIVSQLQGPYGNGHLSNDGQTMVTAYRDSHGSYSLRCWDLPLRPPLYLVIGITLAVGLMVLLFSRWRARRKVRIEAAAGSVIPEPSPTIGK